jgi:hypothetical protein
MRREDFLFFLFINSLRFIRLGFLINFAVTNSGIRKNIFIRYFIFNRFYFFNRINSFYSSIFIANCVIIKYKSLFYLCYSLIITNNVNIVEINVLYYNLNLVNYTYVWTQNNLKFFIKSC